MMTGLTPASISRANSSSVLHADLSSAQVTNADDQLPVSNADLTK